MRRRVEAWDAALIRAALGRIPTTAAPGLAQAAHLLTLGRRTNTKTSYASKWQRFVHFCTTTQSDHGCKPLAYLPASERTVLTYLGFLSDEGLVHETSLNPYLAAINQAHEDIGLPRPALGHHLTLLRKGFAAQEGDHNPNASSRMPVPADVMLDILHLGLNTDNSHILRMCACLVVCYSWYNRADTGIQLQRSHVTLTDTSMTINTKSKTCARNVACPITRRFDPRHDPDALVYRLLLRWHTLSRPHHSVSDIYWS